MSWVTHKLAEALDVRAALRSHAVQLQPVAHGPLKYELVYHDIESTKVLACALQRLVVDECQSELMYLRGGPSRALVFIGADEAVATNEAAEIAAAIVFVVRVGPGCKPSRSNQFVEQGQMWSSPGCVCNLFFLPGI